MKQSNPNEERAVKEKCSRYKGKGTAKELIT
jgi:hypothetical protein